MPYRSRSQLVCDILYFLAQQPNCPLYILADSFYATKDYIHQLPEIAHAVGRFPISANLYHVPPKPTYKRWGFPAKKAT